MVWITRLLLAASLIAALGLGCGTLYTAENDPETWPIVYQDEFQDPDSGWQLKNTGSITKAYVDGTYEIQVKQPQESVWSQIPGAREFSDFHAETSVRVTRGTGEFGFVFRYQDENNYYVLLIDTSGTWRMMRCDEGNEFRHGGYWLKAQGQLPPEFDATQWNSVAITVQSKEFLLHVNGDLVTEEDLTWYKPVGWQNIGGVSLPRQEDATIYVGTIGLCAGTDESKFAVQFDSFVIRRDPSTPSYIPDVLVQGFLETAPLLEEARNSWQSEPALTPEIERISTVDLAEIDAQCDLAELSSRYGFAIRECRPAHLALADFGGSSKDLVISDENVPILYVVRGQEVSFIVVEELLQSSPLPPLAIESLESGDLDGDGVDEIVATTKRSILIFEYRGTELSLAHEIPTDQHNGRVIIADLDGDGLPDLVTSNGAFYQTSRGSSLYLPYDVPSREGRDGFGTRYDLQVADLDGNGLLDIVRSFRTTNWDFDGLEILHQDSPRQFSSSATFLLQGNLSGVAVGDINNDRLPDICATQEIQEGHLIVFIQKADRSFDAPVVYPSYYLPSSPVIADLDGDGLNDVAVLSEGWDRISVYYQREGTGLQPYVLYSVPTFNGGGPTPHRAMLSDDAKRDGRHELIIRSWDQQLVCIISSFPTPTGRSMPGTSSAGDNFSLLDIPSAYPEFLPLTHGNSLLSASGRVITEPESYALTAADLTGDGRQEVIVVDGRYPSLYIYKGAHVSAFDLGISPSWRDIVSVEASDLDGNGRVDIVVYLGGSPEREDILILEYDGNHLRQTAHIVTDRHVGGVRIADVDRDGFGDLVTAVGVYFLRDRNPLDSSRFSDLEPFAGSWTVRHTELSDLAVADFNGDGLPDIARTFTLLTNGDKTTGLEILYQNENGSFTPPALMGPIVPPYSWDAQIAAGDVTGDGAADLVLCMRDHGYLFVQEHSKLQGPIELDGGTLRAPIIADVDGDGKSDVACLGTWDKLVVFRQGDRGQLLSPTTFVVSTAQTPGPQSLVASDIDDDGRLDLIMLANYDQGLSIFPSSSLAVPRGTSRPVTLSAYWHLQLDLAKTSLGEAWAALQLGVAYLAEARYEDALDAIKEALNTGQGADLPALEAYSLLIEGDVYHALGLQEEATGVWRSAYAIFNRIEHFSGRQAALLRLGLVGFLDHDYEDASYYWKTCFAVSWKTLDEATSAAAGSISSNLGLAALLAGDPGRARMWFGLAFHLNQRDDRQLGQAYVLGNVAFFLLQDGQYADAVRTLQAAQELLSFRPSDESDVQEIKWLLSVNLALAYETAGNLESALEQYKQAIEIIESIRASIVSEKLKTAWQQRTQGVYERLIRLLINQGQESDAFSYAERCRARTFLDLLAVGPVGTIENVAEEGIKSGVVNPDAIGQDVQDVIASLPADTAALEYFVTDTATYVWVIRDGAINGPIIIAHSREELMNKVIEAREQLEEQDTVVNRDLAELYDWLIRPVEGFLPETTGEGEVPHLIIIPSGPLYYLPFQALIWTSEDYKHSPLIARYALSYSPSVATLKYAEQRGASAYPQSTFLGVADPDTGDPDIPRLPEAQTEVKTVAHLFPISEVYVDKQATEDVVQSHSATAREVLLSTHGLFNPHNPMFSYLLTTPTVKNNDGKLHAYEVFQLPLHADMVVLSACETLLPSLEQMTDQLNEIARRAGDNTPQKLTEDQLKELTAGDEVVGLTRAFISAGAASVLSSLWSVPSGATSQLMVSFHNNMQKGMDKAHALRAAQLEVMNTAGYTYPWYWAAFNLMGDWR